MSNIIDIQQFLVGKTFIIPAYQRDYAWTTVQVDDLFEDISEAIATGTSHYLGAVVLSRSHSGPYEVVDGQQRLSTLALVIHALLEELSPGDQQRIADTAILLRQGNDLKLHFGNNAEFVADLFAGVEKPPKTAGQRRLRAAYRYARERAKVLSSKGGRGLITKWMNTLKTLEIIQFVAEDTGRAIRMFQTVNDRGLPLSAMDKTKALLVFYSNRHLGGVLDARINTALGACFAAFDAIRECVSQPGLRIDNIARDAFSEDDLLRYHYLSYTFPDVVDGGDYEGSLRTVFDSFLKGTLKLFSTDQTKLRAFMEDYVEDLSGFCGAFRDVVSKMATDARLYKYFVFLGVSARLYPLTIRLHRRNMLFTTPLGTHNDLLKCLETCDVRVYKTRGTDPAKDMGVLSHASRSATAEQIADSLRAFTGRFMPDGYFQTLLGQDMYHNQALPLILLSYDEECAGGPYDCVTLQDLVTRQITREHILAQDPSFTVGGHGFANNDEFEAHLHQLGNMTPLTKSENSRCSNISVHTKMTDQNLYPSSRFAGTRRLAQEYMAVSQHFQKADLQARTQELSAWVQRAWPLR